MSHVRRAMWLPDSMGSRSPTSLERMEAAWMVGSGWDESVVWACSQGSCRVPRRRATPFPTCRNSAPMRKRSG
ncbi:protein of unknown function [Pararobbsia alpina]